MGRVKRNKYEGKEDGRREERREVKREGGREGGREGEVERKDRIGEVEIQELIDGDGDGLVSLKAEEEYRSRERGKKE